MPLVPCMGATHNATGAAYLIAALADNATMRYVAPIHNATMRYVAPIRQCNNEVRGTDPDHVPIIVAPIDNATMRYVAPIQVRGTDLSGQCNNEVRGTDLRIPLHDPFTKEGR